MKNRRIIFHPFLFAALPVISLLSHNIDGLALINIVRPLLLVQLAAALFFAASRLLMKDWARAGIVCSLFLILFFSYGHVYGGFLGPFTQSIFSQSGLTGQHAALFFAWGIIFVFGAWAASRLKRLASDFNQVLNVIALAALAMPLYGIIRYEVRLQQPWSAIDLTGCSIPAELPQQHTLKDRPDIYYIILDGYGRGDYLNQFYEYDNTPFLEFLKERGFYVANLSQANYVKTVLSLSASLNMSYLDFLSQRPGINSADPSPTARLIRWGTVQQQLQDLGYQVVAFSTGNRATELENADLFLRPPTRAATVFERLVMDTSALVLWHEVARFLGLPPTYPGYQAHRERITYVLDALADTPRLPGPKFVFIHVIIPHPPFVFGSHGEAVNQKYPFSLMDGNLYLGTPEEYIRGYQDQITYINTQMEHIIPLIQSQSSRPPVIILQGDHGPGARLSWTSPITQALRERTAILNAYYLPGVTSDQLYPQISPVNSFRVVFNAYFGAACPLLPDQSYFSNLVQPYLFTKLEPASLQP